MNRLYAVAKSWAEPNPILFSSGPRQLVLEGHLLEPSVRGLLHVVLTPEVAAQLVPEVVLVPQDLDVIGLSSALTDTGINEAGTPVSRSNRGLRGPPCSSR